MPKKPKKKSKEEAARKSEARAKEAREEYQSTETQQVKPIQFTDLEWSEAIRGDDYGLAQLAIRVLRDRFVFDVHKQHALEYKPDIGAFLPDDYDQAKVAMREGLEPQLREKVELLNKALGDPATSKDEKSMLTARKREYKHALKTLSTKRGLDNLFDLSRTGQDSIAVHYRVFDRDNDAIHARGHKICLRSGQSRVSQPRDYASKYCDAEWRGLDAECPTFIKFLNDSLGDRPNIINYLQRSAGVAATGFAARDILFLHSKSGSNGKSVLAETLSEILGEYSYALPSQVLMDSPKSGGTGPAPELAEMQGRRFITSSETKKNGLFNIPALKHLTGGDRITARGLYSKQITFKPLHSLWILTNHLSKVGTDEAAFWDRCRIVDFPFQFVDDPDPQDPDQKKRDPDLKAALLTEEEKSGILAWIVRGAMQWHKDDRHLIAPQEVMDLVNAYRLNEDSVEAFVKTCCELESNSEETGKELYTRYEEWYKDQYGENARVLGRKKFGESLSSRFKSKDPKLDSKVRYKTYIGLKLK